MAGKVNVTKAILTAIICLIYFSGGYFIGQSWIPGAEIGLGMALMLIGLVGALLIFQLSEEATGSNLVVILAIVWLLLGLCNVTVILLILEIFR